MVSLTTTDGLPMLVHLDPGDPYQCLARATDRAWRSQIRGSIDAMGMVV